MLRDSLADESAGHHVEQVEISFAPGLDSGLIATAWAQTVAMTEALRISFLIEQGVPVGVEFVQPSESPQTGPPLQVSWDSWLENDRQRPLLAPHEVPWRAVWWPEESRFLWTFHHALLDGRSIARILRDFLERLAGGQPAYLALAEWNPPSRETLDLASEMLRKNFANHQPAHPAVPAGDPREGPAVRFLGQDFLAALESRAAEEEVTPATILIWAWGQALAESSQTGSVMVEHLRCGAPRPGTAGFTMNTLPLLIHRGETLRELRTEILAMRAIETVSPEDFPPGVFPEMDTCSVIMIERGTFQHSVNVPEIVTSLTLHERVGESLMATAHLLPDLRLEVEGAGRHSLLQMWIDVLRQMIPAGSAIFQPSD